MLKKVLCFSGEWKKLLTQHSFGFHQNSSLAKFCAYKMKWMKSKFEIKNFAQWLAG